MGYRQSNLTDIGTYNHARQATGLTEGGRPMLRIVIPKVPMTKVEDHPRRQLCRTTGSSRLGRVDKGHREGQQRVSLLCFMQGICCTNKLFMVPVASLIQTAFRTKTEMKTFYIIQLFHCDIPVLAPSLLPRTVMVPIKASWTNQ